MIRPDDEVEFRVLENALSLYLDTTRDLIGDPDYDQVKLQDDEAACEKLLSQLTGGYHAPRV
jgi:hypothetical protein